MSKFTFTIGEVARLAGITPKTLRHYHQIGLLAEPSRDINNYRLYSIDQLEKIQLIVRLKNIGLSLYQIKTILEASNPDELIRVVLAKHQHRLTHEIRALQNQLENIQQILEADVAVLNQLQPTSSPYSAMTIVSDTVKERSNGLSDILVAVESEVLSKIDGFQWSDGYELFWHAIGKHVIHSLSAHESPFIFWMERYLALRNMEETDLQGKAWLQEFQQSQARVVIAPALQPVFTPLFSEMDQQQIWKLLPSLLYQQGSPLQKKFLSVLLGD